MKTGVKLENPCGGVKMQLTGLWKILEEVDTFISQHVLYVSKLERAIKNREEFPHKNCHQCNFGLKWDSVVVPVKDELPEEVRVDPKNPQPSDEERINRMKELSTLLIQKLLALKRPVK